MSANTPALPALDPLIAEAKSRAHRRRLLALGAALVVAAAVATPLATRSSRTSLGVAATNACGITAAGTQILRNGQTVYREPGYSVHPNGGPPPQVQCSGNSIWAVWLNAGGMMKEAYFGVHSSDGGQTWRPVFTERFFGRKAPHQLDAYFGPWTVHANAAYFVGYCPACSVGKISQTVSLYVTKDGGQTFREYKVPALTGFEPTALRVSREAVTILAKRFLRGPPQHKTATVRVG